jgi:hypothetical protein
MGTKSFLESRDERKRVEMRFAHLKIHHGFERMRLRGLSGARDEFHLTAIVQNLKALALRALKPPNALRSAARLAAPNRTPAEYQKDVASRLGRRLLAPFHIHWSGPLWPSPRPTPERNYILK